MEIKLLNVRSLSGKRLLKTFMRVFIFLMCTTVFCLTTDNSFSQKKVMIEKDQLVTVDQVFEIIKKQTDFDFVYPRGVFKNKPKVQLKKGEITVLKLLEQSLSSNNLNFELTEGNTILIKEKSLNVIPILIESQIQGIQISGTVTDSEGQPLPGANILEKGANNGVQSDFDGKFSLTVANQNAVLVISYLGFMTQEISVNDQTQITVSLKADSAELDEIVVIGYKAVIKRKITSSLATISTRDLGEIPATSLGNAISGRLAGVTITQTGGAPGKTSSINVRGATVGSFGGNGSPLYVIDGIVLSKRHFDALDVSEVATVSVLKDASASAAYGARASNGVILVTTKTGSGKAKLNITSSFGSTQPTKLPEFASAYGHALLMNSALRWNNVDPSNVKYITDSELDYLRTIPNESYLEQLKRTPVLQRYAATLSGGTDKINYFLSGSIIEEDAAFDNLNYAKTNFRAKFDVDVTDDLNVAVNMNTSSDDDFSFSWRHLGNADYDGLYRTTSRNGKWGPAIFNGLPVANFNGWNGANIINKGAGYQTRDNKITNTNIKLSYKVPFLEGLSASLSYNRNTERNDTFRFLKPLVAYTFATDPNNRFVLIDQIVGTRVRRDSGADSSSVLETTLENDDYQFNAQLNYAKTFGDHEISVYGVYEQWEGESKSFSAIGRNVPTELVPTLNATASDDERASSFRSEDGRQSAIGGLNYSFKERYLVSSTFRYDGSVRFAPGNRFGFFPSLSLGWIASEEDFFKDNIGFIDFLKFRYSVGRTGNDNLNGFGGGFPYVQKYVLGSGAVFGNNNTNSNSLSIGAVATALITWEEQTTTNFGLDFQTLNNKLSTSIDVFKNEKRGLFGSRQIFIPESSGVSLSPENYGGIDVTGFEVLTSYNTQVTKHFNMGAGFNFGYTNSVYSNIDDPESTLPRFVREGKRIDRIRTYIADGIIRTQDQLDALIASDFTQFGRAPKIGELLFKDVRGSRTDDPDQNTPDGKIDGNDVDFIPGARGNPPINYGIHLNLHYKNFHLRAFAGGLAGHKRFIPQSGRFTISGIGQSSWTHWSDSWTPENPNASFPVFGGDQGWQQRNSTFFLHDADFLRLKNLNFSYDLPKDAIAKIGMSNLSLFVNTTNLFMIYSKIKSFDPETVGEGIPVNRSYSLGLNLTF